MEPNYKNLLEHNLLYDNYNLCDYPVYILRYLYNCCLK